MRLKWLASLLGVATAVLSLGALSAPAMATTCDDEFTGAAAIAKPGHTGWAEKENWSTNEIPLEGQFACIPEGWGLPVQINLSNLPNPSVRGAGQL
jgi:hypothetical protein